MSKKCNINRAATFDAIMRRRKEEIANQLTGLLMVLYIDIPCEENTYVDGWNDCRKTIREVYECDQWIKRECKK